MCIRDSSCRAQARGIPAGGTGRPGEGGHAGCRASSRGSYQALHCQGRSVPPGCAGEVHTRPTAATMGFLGTLQARLPLPTKAIQVDGGSEFEAAFEEACRELLSSWPGSIPATPFALTRPSAPLHHSNSLPGTPARGGEVLPGYRSSTAGCAGGADRLECGTIQRRPGVAAHCSSGRGWTD